MSTSWQACVAAACLSAAFSHPGLASGPVASEPGDAGPAFADQVASPLLAIDRNRATVVDRVVRQWGDALDAVSAGLARDQLREMLLAMRADQLLAASLAGDLDSLRSIVALALVRDAEVKPSLLAAKALGDASQDVVYVPVTPCRLVETRGTFAAVYQGGGPFTSNQVRTYTLQGGNGVCLTQLPVSVSPSAVQMQVYGIPSTGGSGDIEILPQGGTFGTTATLVYLGNNAFTSAASTSLVNTANKQISVQVRGAGAHVAIDVVGYFRSPQGGYLSSVTAGTGLTGGTITSSGTIAADTAYLQRRVSGTCAAGSSIRTVNADGTVVCEVDDVGGGGTVVSVGSGSGLTGGPITTSGTLSIATGYQLPQGCTNGQVAKSNGSGTWTCASDAGGLGTVTSVATGVGLSGGPITTAGTINLAATQLLPIAACSTGQATSWNGSAWTCAWPNNFTANILLPNSASTDIGNIVKPGGAFLHNFGGNNTFAGMNAGNFVTTGVSNAGFGVNALQQIASASNNTAMGAFSLQSNTSGLSNSALGAFALNSNTAGFNNSATGAFALRYSTTGEGNTAVGAFALGISATGNNNVAVGMGALGANVVGNDNTAIGMNALAQNLASYNVALGRSALEENTTSEQNTALGSFSLQTNVGGGGNTAVGFGAMRFNTSGSSNVALGANALWANGDGWDNVALGDRALVSATNGSRNVAVGWEAMRNLTNGTDNVAIGNGAGANLTTGVSNIDIAHPGVAGESQTIRIGTNQTRTFIAGIRGVSTGVANAVNVVVDSAGQLGTISSSRRFKEDIAEMSDASAALLKLRPVTFRYKSTRGGALQYGLIAEDVADVYPELVARATDGQVETVMYQFLAPMLLNEYQKQQRMIDIQARMLKGQQTEIAELRASYANEIAQLRGDRLRHAAEIAALRRAVEVLLARSPLDDKIARADAE